MSNNMADTSMTPKAPRTLVPKLRFPEFRDAGAWGTKKLSELAVIINEKAGCNKYTLMSISSGIGLVSQLEKFGREIAGAQYKNYIVIRKNDFAYNKSATKEYPEGFIAIYSGEMPAAVPNSIFTCFRVDECKVLPEYLSYLFFCNLHGRWLKNFITVGARVHGSLNIYNDDLLALPVPLPTGYSSQAEQRKIADCLSSIDNLIALEAQKIDALKAHKRGLMQQLFPTEGETIPKLRFPEFRDAGKWDIFYGSDIFEQINNKNYNQNLPLLAITQENGAIPRDAINYHVSVTEKSIESYKVVQVGDFIISLRSFQGGIEYSQHHGICSPAYVILRRLIEGSDIYFKYYFKTERFIQLLTKNLEGLRDGKMISYRQFSELLLPVPKPSEQQKIANFLSAIDELIALQAEKLDTLKVHKKGLMQQLFPSLVEVRE